MSTKIRAKREAEKDKRRELFELIKDYTNHYRQQLEKLKSAETVFRDHEHEHDAMLAKGNVVLNKKIIDGIRVEAYLDAMVLRHFYWHDELVREALTPAMDTILAIPGVADAIRAKMEEKPNVVMTRILA